jgi:hypothetical protein
MNRKKDQSPKEPSEFERLASEKAKLWNEVRDDPRYRETDQYQRINEIDQRLWELVKSKG